MKLTGLIQRCVLIGVLTVMLAGCAGVRGEYYLAGEQYSEGHEHFEEVVASEPGNASAQYYLGRMLLAKDKPQDSLMHFQKAVAIAPEDDTYHFWLGINYWAIMDYRKERQAYKRALELNPHKTYARLYLGHNYLDQKEWKKALEQYQLVLKKNKYDPEALFNKASALRGLKRNKEEHAALLAYLKYYPDGQLALRAVDRLNLLGDFSWRNHYIGKRKVSFIAVSCKKGTAEIKPDTKASLKLLGAMLKNSPDLSVNVVVYVKGDAKLAKKRAVAIREYITTYMPDVEKKQLPLSWFSRAEVLRAERTYVVLNESVQLVTKVD